jgi:hypothetical protein
MASDDSGTSVSTGFLVKPPRFSLGIPKLAVSEALRLTKTIYGAICRVVADGNDSLRPGDIVGYMRDEGRPLDSWEVRGQFSQLENLGLLKIDVATGIWQLVDGVDFDEATTQANGSARSS